MAGRVHPQQLIAGGPGCLDPVECGVAVVIQCLQYHAQPCRLLGMPRPGIVQQAGGMGVQPQHAAAYPAGWGLRRRACCHSTSPWPLARASTREITNSRSDRRLR